MRSGPRQGWLLTPNRAVGLLLFLVLAAGCATTPSGGSRLNFWPLLVYQEEPAAGIQQLELLGPLFSWARHGEQTTTTLAPLVYWQEQGATGAKAEFLYPFGQWRREAGDSRFNLIPLSTWRREAGGAVSGQVFPVFWGRTAAGVPYGGIFPLYGVFRERFGRDHITFIFWPLFTRAQGNGSQYYRVLWPLFSWSTGRETGLACWPLFGYRRQPGVAERFYALWPLLHFHRLRQDTDNPQTIRMFLPFWVWEQTPGSRRLSWLFPFFSHYTQTKGRYEQWDIVWPFYVWGEGEGFRFRQYFPWYYQRLSWPASEQREEIRRWLWYGWVQETEESPAGWRQDWRWLLFSRWRREIGSPGDWREEWRCWPLAAGHARTGVRTWRALAPLPLASEGWERLFGPYLEVASLQEAGGWRRGRLLWGLLRWDATPAWRMWELGFLASGQTWADGCRYRLLAGLVTWEKQGPQRQLRLFYLPWGWRWEGR